MTQAEFIRYIREDFKLPPTHDQQVAMETFTRFLADRGERVAMIMRGSAGTGKTSLAGAMLRTLRRFGQKVMVMAPTGRAAKVFSLHSGMPAYTIHRRIYREKSYQGLDGRFNLNNNRYSNVLFVVDEASMVSSIPSFDSAFGSGSLLDDLMQYVFNGAGCRLLFIGDCAQLPPIGEAEAPALCAATIEHYGIRVYQSDLNEVLRQGADSGILYNATYIRHLITHDTATELPKITLRGFADIERVDGNELIDSLEACYSRAGIDETIVVTRSNKRANLYNQGIRNRVLDREEMLSSGDMLMIVRNNYFWTDRLGAEGLSAKGKEVQPDNTPAFLANGDRARVMRVSRERELYGFRFADVWLRFPDYDDFEMEATLLLDSLITDAPALTQEQNEQLFRGVMVDYADLPTKLDRLKALRSDIYFNALQVKFAYAVTCHKAQGGQWQYVYVDQGYMTADMLTPDYIHWLYTAFTRATEKLFLINWPEPQIAKSQS